MQFQLCGSFALVAVDTAIAVPAAHPGEEQEMLLPLTTADKKPISQSQHTHVLFFDYGQILPA